MKEMMRAGLPEGASGRLAQGGSGRFRGRQQKMACKTDITGIEEDDMMNETSGKRDVCNNSTVL